MSNALAHIAFGADGTLINGQHRLTAIVEHGKPQPCFVVKGLDPRLFLVTDRQRTRRMAQFLDDVKYPSQVGSACRFAVMWLKGSFPFGWNFRVEPIDQSDFLAENPGIVRSVDLVYSTGAWSLGIPGYQGFLHYYYVHIEGVDPEVVDEFFARCGSGVGLAPHSPELSLRTRVFVNNNKGTRIDKMAWILKSLKASIRGEKQKICRWSSTEDFPELSIGGGE